VYTVI